MIELRISLVNSRHQLLKERLEQMSFARKIIEIPSNELPSLKEGKQLYQGVTNIEHALTELATFKSQWYACTCDKYDWL